MSALVKILLGILCITILAVIFVPVSVGSPRHAAKRTQTLSNLKQVSLVMQIYADDNNDRFPPDTSSVNAAEPYLIGYLKNKEITRSLNLASPNFLGNGALATRAQSKIVRPEELLEFFDSAPWESQIRVVSFADSHAKVIKESLFQTSIANGFRYKQ